MLPSRGFVSTAGVLRQGARFQYRFPTARTYLTAINPSSSLSLRSGRITGASSIVIAAQSRLASTSAPPPPPPASTIPPPPSSSAVPPTSPTDALNTDANAFNLEDAIDFANMPERIGYLKDVGLDYGWGPTAMVEWALEHVHVYSGMPWWGSIAVTAFLFRLSLAPVFVKSADAGAKMRAMQPLTKPIQARMMEALKSGDQLNAARARQDLAAINKASGISNFDIFLPAALQGIFGFCAFRLLRAMGNLPVPGLETGGFGWITDLTQADPYFILPAIMAASMHFVFRMGGESGSPINESMKPIMLYILPGVIFISTAWLPAALSVWLTVTGGMGITQVTLFKQDWVRRILGMTPLVNEEQARLDAIARGLVKEEKTINVQAKSRPAGQKPVYQAPNIKFSATSATSSTTRPASATKPAPAPFVNPIEQAKGWFGKVSESFSEQRDSLAAQWGGAQRKKKSKTRSDEMMRRAEAYERRWKESRK